MTDRDEAERTRKRLTLLAKGAEYHQINELDRAEQIYRRFLEDDPDHPEANRLLGLLHHQRGRLDRCLARLRRAVRFDPGQPDYLHDLGLALESAGFAEEATGYLERALKLSPDSPDLLNDLGNAYAALNRFDRAAECYSRALKVDPDNQIARINLAKTTADLGRPDEALVELDRLAGLDPDNALIQAARGSLLAEAGRWREAAPALEAALRLAPHRTDLLINYGAVLINLNRYDEAERAVSVGLANQPDNPEAINNLAKLRRNQGRLDEALELYDQALALAPDNPTIHFNRGVALLLQGRLGPGWSEYNWRFRDPGKATEIGAWSGRAPLWRGRTRPDETLLVLAEQGLGDAVQFARFLPLARKRFGRLVLACPRALIPLLTGQPGVDQVIDRSEAGEFPADRAVFLMSLPGLLGLNLPDLPAETPYLKIDPDLEKAWADRIDRAAVGRLKVGLAWSGRPEHGNDHNRSLAPELLAPLAGVDRVAWFRLGREDYDPAACPNGMNLLDFTDKFIDIAALGGLIANLDLVISVDTLAAHLAGALAKPVWTLLPFAPDWRWMLDRSDSPWHPTMRLFRQPTPGDWTTVMGEVADELKRAVTRDGNLRSD